jgi:hypothetical protein
MSGTKIRLFPHNNDLYVTETGMGLFSKINNLLDSIVEGTLASRGISLQQSKASGLFKFQEEGEEPARDNKDRVIVKVQTGESIELDSYVKENSTEVSKALLGKPEIDKDIYERSVRLRMFRNSNGSDSVELETIRGDFVGFVRKADTPMALHIIDSLTEQIGELVPDLGSLVFDVGAKVSGGYSEDYDEDGKSMPSGYFDSLVIKVRDSADIEIYSQQ